MYISSKQILSGVIFKTWLVYSMYSGKRHKYEFAISFWCNSFLKEKDIVWVDILYIQKEANHVILGIMLSGNKHPLSFKSF